MNKMQKMAWLIGMMMLPTGFVFAGPADGLTNDLIINALIFLSFIIFIFIPYIGLQQKQNISIPTFHNTLNFSLDNITIERQLDESKDVEQGLWYINIPKNEHTKSAMKIDFNKFYLMVDSQKTVHNFLIELDDTPEKHCGLPKNTLLGWRKSQPKTILVATYPTHNVPQACWGKKLQKVSVDEMHNALPQQDGWYLNMVKRHFETEKNKP